MRLWIGRSEARRIGQGVAVARGHDPEHGVKVNRVVRSYVVTFGYRQRGGVLRVIVDARTGDVVRTITTPR